MKNDYPRLKGALPEMVRELQRGGKFMPEEVDLLTDLVAEASQQRERIESFELTATFTPTAPPMTAVRRAEIQGAWA